MDICITSAPLCGTVTPPPSKSMAHRVLLAAALADGESTIENVSLSQDIAATLRCMAALGAHWKAVGKTVLRISGIGGKPRPTSEELPRFDCRESGSTLRFLIPIALAVAGGGVFTGQGRLMERPQQPYLDLFEEKGIFYRKQNGALTVRGKLEPGEYRLPGNVSSQFFTGLLFALPLLNGPSTILPTTEMESWDYILMTMDALMGARVAVTDPQPLHSAFSVSPFSYRPFHCTVENDWSQAAFWYAANFLDCDLNIEGLNPHSAQGDRAADALSQRLKLPGDVEIDLSGCPDLLPPLAVMAAVRSGETRFVNAARLRLKESDRLKTTAGMLRALGAIVSELPDALFVQGGTPLSGGRVDGANDHRIVMAAAVAAAACSGPVTILGAEAVNKSYPSFWDEYQRLGGKIHVL